MTKIPGVQGIIRRAAAAALNCRMCASSQMELQLPPAFFTFDTAYGIYKE
jgi:hypothetical protein